MIARQSKKYSALRDRMRRSAGFTLAELMIVVALIGFVAAMGVPSYIKALPHMRLKSAAGEISGALQYARLNAIAHNEYYRVRFFYDNNTFKIYRKKGGGTWKEVPTSVGSEKWKDIDLLAPGVAVSISTMGVVEVVDDDGQPSFIYKPDGTVEMGNASQAVYLRNKNEPSSGYQNYRVKVTKSGIVSIQVYTGDDWGRG